MIISDQKVSLIKRELASGSSNLAHIASKVGVSRPTVRRYSKILGYHKGNKVRLKEHTLDLTYFKSIDTPEKAYVLGLIYADGCNTRRGLQISLGEDDKEVIEFVKTQLKASDDLRFIPKSHSTWKNKWELSIKSVELSKQLIRVGCLPAKSLIIKFPDFIAEELISHFIRGFFDGDGSIWKRQGGWHMSFTCGSRDFIYSLQEILSKQDIYSQIYLTGKNKNCFSLNLARRKDIEKIIRYMYNNSTFSMERKRLKAQDCLGERIQVLF